jgi:hypothetical protein
VKERFFLHRVYALRHRLSVHECVERAASILPYVAEPALAVPDNAAVRTKPATDSILRQLFVQHRLFHCWFASPFHANPLEISGSFFTGRRFCLQLFNPTRDVAQRFFQLFRLSLEQLDFVVPTLAQRLERRSI